MKRWAIRHLRGAAQPPIELRGERAVGLLALWAAALALRPQVIVLGPLLPDVMDDLRVSHAVAGLLSTIPILCMGVFAPLAPWVAGRVGASRGIGLSLAVIAVFGLVRLWPAGAWVVVVLTVGVGLGMGMGNGILPVVTKERFADRPAFATGVYVFGINVGSLAAAAAAIPIARLGGGWRTPLAAFSLATALLAAPWLASGAEGSAAPPPAPGHLRPAAARPRAWGIAAIFALLTVVFYGANAWLPAYYVERGWSSPDAGRALAVFHLVPLFVTLPVAWLADRVGSRRAWLGGGGVVMVGAFLGVLWGAAHGWLWSGLLGGAVGALFSLVMTLPLDVCDDPRDVGAVAAVMLGVGFVLAAAAPAALGAVRDGTGSFVPVIWLLLASAAAFGALAAWARTS